MIAPPSIVIGCDHPACTIAFRSGATSEAGARRQARQAGWGARLTRHRAAPNASTLVDYCPAHVADHLSDSVDAGPL